MDRDLFFRFIFCRIKVDARKGLVGEVVCFHLLGDFWLLVLEKELVYRAIVIDLCLFRVDGELEL